MQRINNLIDDSDSDEEIIPRRQRWLKERKDLFEYYDDNDFAMRFRLSKEATLFLLSKIERNLEYISDRPFQSGFRPGHSTVTALTKISDDIREGMSKQRVTVLVLLDFSNAFNSVDYDVLLAMLKSIFVSDVVVDWFRSYLAGRQQCQKKSRSRTGGRRTFQHCEAANIKDPRNAAVRCFGVTKTYEHDLLGYLLTSLAQINLSYRHFSTWTT
ncbi:hypothetical protein evm_013273 [Chilo suppressalis]|nr:hypothetical protein evm_013273 [Chilo suppressalis]